MTITDKYWWVNKADGVRAWVRVCFAPSTICGEHKWLGQPGGIRFRCDRKRGHKGNHMDRLWCARFRRAGTLRIPDTLDAS